MEIPPGQKQFECEHCQAAILVPIDLPATSAPCPVCQAITTSPSLEVPSSPPNAPPERAALPAEPQNLESDQQKGGAGVLWGLAALTFVALLLGGFWLFKKSRVEKPATDVSELAEVAAGKVGSASIATGVEEEALAVLKNFLTATSVEEKAKYVIGKEKAIPDMRAFYGRGEIKADELRADFFSEWAMDTSDTERGIYLMEFDQPKQFKLGELFSPITDLKTHLSLEDPDMQTRSKAYRQNFEMEAIRAMVFLRRIDEELLVDWHIFTQTKNRLFRDFVNYPVAGRKGTFRVTVMEHVSTLYEDDPSVRRYRVIDPAHFEDDYTVVTVDKTTDVGRILEKLAWTDISGKRSHGSGSGATLVLEWTSAPTPVLKIAKVVCWEFLGVGGDPSNLQSAN